MKPSEEICIYLWQLYLHNNPGEFSFFTFHMQHLLLSDISIESNTIRIVNAEGNTSACFYLCIRVGNISEQLSNELAILRNAFASTSIDCEFRNWVLLYTPQDLPRRALLNIFGELRDLLFRVRNTLSQRFNISLAEGRTDFHLSLDRVHDALPGEPTLVDTDTVDDTPLA